MNYINENYEYPEPIKKDDEYLKFTSLENGSTIRFTLSATGNRYVQYSRDGQSWTNLGSSSITFNKDEFIYCRGAFEQSTNYSSTPLFYMTGKWSASGHLNSLLYNSDYTERLTDIPTCGFCQLFRYLTSLYDVSELSFDGIYRFGGTGCCRMFLNCSNIESITVDGPVIVRSDPYSIQEMFDGCKKLTYIAFPTATGSGTIGGTYFSNGVPSNATFVKNSNSTWNSGTSGIQSTWTIITA